MLCHILMTLLQSCHLSQRPSSIKQTSFRLEKKKFVMETATKYSTSEQLYNNYSPRSNGDLLRLYGFVEVRRERERESKCKWQEKTYSSSQKGSDNELNCVPMKLE